LLNTSLTLWICEVNETIFLLTRKKYFCKKPEEHHILGNLTKVLKKQRQNRLSTSLIWMAYK
jgi:hypothetical protein